MQPWWTRERPSESSPFRVGRTSRRHALRPHGGLPNNQPATDLLTGTARIDARASQALSAFNLDLAGLTVRSVQVGGRAATWTRAGSELVVTPARPIGKGSRFSTVIRYDGVPQTNVDPQLGQEGFIHTDDGAVVIGEPHVAATWYPVNDHPSDKATYDIKITVPAGLQAISNGTLCGTRTHNGKTTWSWRARDPWRPTWPRPPSGSSR